MDAAATPAIHRRQFKIVICRINEEPAKPADNKGRRRGATSGNPDVRTCERRLGFELIEELSLPPAG
jgi:hypothetical protein